MAEHARLARERHTDLANFLRTRRARLSPVQAGLPMRARRRTPGLRREEVAELIGVSATWYTWLEQGRDIMVSVEVIENLARVLQLSPDERIHLFRLARRSAPAASPQWPEAVSPAFHDLLRALEPHPAHIRDHRWDVLAWNRAEALVADWAALPPAERNVVWYHFAHPRLRQLMVDWENEASTLLALFRMESTRYRDDPWLHSLIERLLQVSAEFRQWWPQHDVRQEKEQPIAFQPPGVGRLVLQPVSAVFMADPRLTLRVLLPAPSTDRAATLNRLTHR